MKATATLPVCLLLVWTHTALAATITVGKGGGYDCSTIQAAIDAASAGDTIVVYPAAYVENINLKGKNLTVRSTNPMSAAVVAATIIDGNRAGSVVTFAGSENSSCVLAGFTITNGSSQFGGGIKGNRSRATIRHNIVVANLCIGHPTFTEPCGGGLWRCDGLIEYNTITSNTAEPSWGWGGGLEDCDGTIQYNVISHNHVGLAGAGLDHCDGLIQANLIYGNTSDCNGGGFSDCNGPFRNNVIAGNRALGIVVSPFGDRGEGGGCQFSGATLFNNVIFGNTALRGGGLNLQWGTIRNNIIWGNSAPNDSQISRSAVPSFSCIQNWTGGGTGNIAEDPQLADPVNGDFHLLEASPCIDAGGTVLLTMDFEGDLRPFDFTSTPRGDGSDFDIGADEAVTHLTTTFTITWPTTGTVWQARTIGNLAFTSKYLPGPSQAEVEVWNAGSSVTSLGRVPCQNGLNTVPVQLPATVPAGPGYRIRMFWTVNPSVNSFSGEFTVIPAPTFVVTWPTTGTVWQAGKTGYLGFTCQHLPGPSQADVEVWKGGTSVTSLGRVPCQNGLNTVPVPLPATVPGGSGYRIRMFWTVNRAFNSFSNEFTVSPAPTFTITWPTTGTIWQAGVPGTVSFTCANLPQTGLARLEVWRNGSHVRGLGQVWSQNGLNRTPIRLPADLAPRGNYQLRLSWWETATVNAFSGKFTVTAAPTFAISWPATGTVWQAGTLRNLTYTCANLPGPSFAWVELWRDGRALEVLTQVRCQNGANSAPVRLPAALSPASTYQIRLYWTGTAAVEAFSGKFTVTPAPTFLVTWPGTGTVWRAGTVGNLTFLCANLPASGQARVELWRDGRSLRSLAQVPCRNGLNSVAVRLPDDVAYGVDYQVAVFWFENAAVGALSGFFTIARIAQPLSASRFHLYR